jgi:hypothetical protein
MACHVPPPARIPLCLPCFGGATGGAGWRAAAHAYPIERWGTAPAPLCPPPHGNGP